MLEHIIKLTDSIIQLTNKEEPAANASGVIEKAQQYLGLPYVWGSASPSNGGFDCSGFIFTFWVFLPKSPKRGN